MNSYVLYKETFYLHPAVNDDVIDSHKQFLIEFVNSLIRRAKLENRTAPVTRQATPVCEVEPVIHLDLTSTLSLLGPSHHRKPLIMSVSDQVIIN